MNTIEQINTIINNLNSLTVQGVTNMTIVIDTIQRLTQIAQAAAAERMRAAEAEAKKSAGTEDDEETIDGVTYRFGEVSK